MNKCRLCLSSERPVDLFDPRLKSAQELRYFILLGTGVQILETDTVSKRVCHRCLIIAVKCFKYRKSACENDRVLKLACGQEYTPPLANEEEIVRLHQSISAKITCNLTSTESSSSIPSDDSLTINTSNLKEQAKPNSLLGSLKITQATLNQKTKSTRRSMTISPVGSRVENREPFSKITNIVHILPPGIKIERLETKHKHPSIQKLVQKYNSILLPEDVFKDDIDPVVSLDKSEVTDWYEEYEKAIRHKLSSNAFSPNALQVPNNGAKKTKKFVGPKCEMDRFLSASSKPAKSPDKFQGSIKNYFIPLGSTSTSTSSTPKSIQNIKSVAKKKTTVFSAPRRVSRKRSSSSRDGSDSQEVIPPKKIRKFGKTSSVSKIDLPTKDSANLVSPKDVFTSSLELTPVPGQNLLSPIKGGPSSLLSATGKEIDLFICYFCNKVCDTRKQLKEHEKTHVKCNICKKKLKNIEALTKHIKDSCIINCKPVIKLDRIDLVPSIVAKYKSAFMEVTDAEDGDCTSTSSGHDIFSTQSKHGYRKTNLKPSRRINLICDDEDDVYLCYDDLESHLDNEENEALEISENPAQNNSAGQVIEEILLPMPSVNFINECEEVEMETMFKEPNVPQVSDTSRVTEVVVQTAAEKRARRRRKSPIVCISDDSDSDVQCVSANEDKGKDKRENIDVHQLLPIVPMMSVDKKLDKPQNSPVQQPTTAQPINVTDNFEDLLVQQPSTAQPVNVNSKEIDKSKNSVVQQPAIPVKKTEKGKTESKNTAHVIESVSVIRPVINCTDSTTTSHTNIGEAEFIQDLFKKHIRGSAIDNFAQTFEPLTAGIRYTHSNLIIVEKMFPELFIYKVPLCLEFRECNINASFKVNVPEDPPKIFYSWKHLKAKDVIGKKTTQVSTSRNSVIQVRAVESINSSEEFRTSVSPVSVNNAVTTNAPLLANLLQTSPSVPTTTNQKQLVSTISLTPSPLVTSSLSNSPLTTQVNVASGTFITPNYIKQVDKNFIPILPQQQSNLQINNSFSNVNRIIVLPNHNFSVPNVFLPNHPSPPSYESTVHITEVTDTHTQNGEVVPYTQKNSTIVPYTQQNSTIIPYTQQNNTIVPYTQQNPLVVPYTQQNPLVVPYSQQNTVVLPFSQPNAMVIPYTQQVARQNLRVRDLSTLCGDDIL